MPLSADMHYMTWGSAGLVDGDARTVSWYIFDLMSVFEHFLIFSKFIWLIFIFILIMTKSCLRYCYSYYD